MTFDRIEIICKKDNEKVVLQELEKNEVVFSRKSLNRLLRKKAVDHVNRHVDIKKILNKKISETTKQLGKKGLTKEELSKLFLTEDCEKDRQVTKTTAKMVDSCIKMLIDKSNKFGMEVTKWLTSNT